jgi:hypothetical protein
MSYIVQAEESEGHSAVSKTYEDRKDALVTAVQWGARPEGQDRRQRSDLHRGGIGDRDHQRRAAVAAYGLTYVIL